MTLHISCMFSRIREKGQTFDFLELELLATFVETELVFVGELTESEVLLVADILKRQQHLFDARDLLTDRICRKYLNILHCTLAIFKIL